MVPVEIVSLASSLVAAILRLTEFDAGAAPLLHATYNKAALAGVPSTVHNVRQPCPENRNEMALPLFHPGRLTIVWTKDDKSGVRSARPASLTTDHGFAFHVTELTDCVRDVISYVFVENVTALSTVSTLVV